jgi:hypothetical protein
MTLAALTGFFGGLDFVAQLIAHVVTVIGFPIAIWSYWKQSELQHKDRERQRIDRENGTYSSLDDRYMEYLKLCVEFPNLGMFNPVQKVRTDYSDAEVVQRYAMFEILLSIFERAYLMMYDDRESAARGRQWSGWETYLKSWRTHPDFKDLWEKLGNGFDSDFVKYVDAL